MYHLDLALEVMAASPVWAVFLAGLDPACRLTNNRLAAPVLGQDNKRGGEYPPLFYALDERKTGELNNSLTFVL